ncbi:MFS transporter [Nocardia miyunensis]|uniref:MFS transporter n=1 Tax=Nocardia miyunensis TaxID=282684 RepID=UPI001FE1554E|nr:MFS transporter [Nocardia miyunensis]
MSALRAHPLILPVVLTATFMQLLDVTIAQVALSSIQRDLRASQDILPLVLAGYTLSYGCLLITAGRLGDRYGYRRLYAVGMSLFTLASVACTAAPTASALVLARLVQGAGSGLMAPQVLSIIQTAVPAPRRPHALGLLGATMGVASLAGPLLGGILLGADLFGLGWRLIFLVNVPVGLLALAGSVLLPSTRATTRPRLDVVGATLAMTGLGLLVFPLSVGPDTGWPAWTWLCFGSAAVVLGLFVLTQFRHDEPLVHPSVFRDRIARSGILLVFVFNAGVPSFTYLLFLYLQSGLGFTPLAAALTSAPYPAAAVVGSRAAAALARRYRGTLLPASAVLLALAIATLTVVITRDGHRWAALPAMAVGGAAFGTFTASVFSLVLTDVKPGATGSASGLLPTAQQIGGTIGVSLAGLVFVLPAASPTAAFGHAMAYEIGVFLLTAVISLRLVRNGRRHRPAGRSDQMIDPTSWATR